MITLETKVKSNTTNIRSILLSKINGRRKEIRCIQIKILKIGEVFQIYNLKEDFSLAEYEKYLSNIDFFADHDSYEGIVWFKDYSYLTYERTFKSNGMCEWVLHSTPKIPESCKSSNNIMTLAINIDSVLRGLKNEITESNIGVTDRCKNDPVRMLKIITKYFEVSKLFNEITVPDNESKIRTYLETQGVKLNDNNLKKGNYVNILLAKYLMDSIYFTTENNIEVSKAISEILLKFSNVDKSTNIYKLREFVEKELIEYDFMNRCFINDIHQYLKKYYIGYIYESGSVDMYEHGDKLLKTMSSHITQIIYNSFNIDKTIFPVAIKKGWIHGLNSISEPKPTKCYALKFKNRYWGKLPDDSYGFINDINKACVSSFDNINKFPANDPYEVTIRSFGVIVPVNYYDESHSLSDLSLRKVVEI